MISNKQFALENKWLGDFLLPFGSNGLFSERNVGFGEVDGNFNPNNLPTQTITTQKHLSGPREGVPTPKPSALFSHLRLVEVTLQGFSSASWETNSKQQNDLGQLWSLGTTKRQTHRSHGPGIFSYYFPA